MYIGSGTEPFNFANYARKIIKENNLPLNIQFTRKEKLTALIFVEYFLLENIQGHCLEPTVRDSYIRNIQKLMVPSINN